MEDLLSKMERVELINSTILNITNHYLKPFLLPHIILKSVDKRIRDFFWGHAANTKTFHKINWKEIAKTIQLQEPIFKFGGLQVI